MAKLVVDNPLMQLLVKVVLWLIMLVYIFTMSFTALETNDSLFGRTFAKSME